VTVATTNRSYDDGAIVDAVTDLPEEDLLEQSIDDVQVNFDAPAPDGTASARIVVRQTFTVRAELANEILNGAT
jgi:hypothetical protein